MSRKTDLELTERQEKIRNSFIHVSLFNGWDTKMDIFINENFEYELAFSNARKTIKEKDKLTDSVIETLNNLMYNVNPISFQSYQNSGWTDIGIFFIGYTTKFKQSPTIAQKGKWDRIKSFFITGKQKEELYQSFQENDVEVIISNPIGSLESEDVNYSEDEKALCQVKRAFDRIFSENIKKYQ